MLRFAVVQTIIRRASNACSSFLKPYLQVSCRSNLFACVATRSKKPAQRWPSYVVQWGVRGQARPAFAWPSASLQTEHEVLCRGVADTHGGLPLKSTIKLRIICEIRKRAGAGGRESPIFFSWKFYKTLYFNKLGSCVLIKRVTLLVILLVSTWGSRTQLLSYSVL